MYNPNITWDFLDTIQFLIKDVHKFTLTNNKLTKQAMISIDKHRLRIQQRINYLAKYIIMGSKLFLYPDSITVDTSGLAYNRISMIYALEFTGVSNILLYSKQNCFL